MSTEQATPDRPLRLSDRPNDRQFVEPLPTIRVQAILSAIKQRTGHDPMPYQRDFAMLASNLMVVVEMFPVLIDAFADDVDKVLLVLLGYQEVIEQQHNILAQLLPTDNGEPAMITNQTRKLGENVRITREATA